MNGKSARRSQLIFGESPELLKCNSVPPNRCGSEVALGSYE